MDELSTEALPRAISATHTFYNENLDRQPASDNTIIPDDFVKVIRQDVTTTILTSLEPSKLKITQTVEPATTNLQILYCHIFAVPLTMTAVATSTSITTVTSYQPIGYRTIGPLITPVSSSFPNTMKGADELGEFEITTTSAISTPYFGTEENILTPASIRSTIRTAQRTPESILSGHYFIGPDIVHRSTHIVRALAENEPLPKQLNYLDMRYHAQPLTRGSVHRGEFPLNFGLPKFETSVVPEAAVITPGPYEPKLEEAGPSTSTSGILTPPASPFSPKLPGAWVVPEPQITQPSITTSIASLQTRISEARDQVRELIVDLESSQLATPLSVELLEFSQDNDHAMADDPPPMYVRAEVDTPEPTPMPPASLYFNRPESSNPWTQPEEEDLMDE